MQPKNCWNSPLQNSLKAQNKLSGAKFHSKGAQSYGLAQRNKHPCYSSDDKLEFFIVDLLQKGYYAINFNECFHSSWRWNLEHPNLNPFINKSIFMRKNEAECIMILSSYTIWMNIVDSITFCKINFLYISPSLRQCV